MLQNKSILKIKNKRKMWRRVCTQALKLQKAYASLGKAKQKRLTNLVGQKKTKPMFTYIPTIVPCVYHVSSSFRMAEARGTFLTFFFREKLYNESAVDAIAEHGATVCVEVLMFLVCYPWLRSRILRRYPKLFGALLVDVSKRVVKLLTQGVDVFKTGGFARNPIFVRKQTNTVASPFTKELVQAQVPRTFRFFFRLLQKRYGFTEPSVSLRLDVPKTKRGRTIARLKEEEEVDLFWLRKKIRAMYGYLSPRALWRTRQRARVRLGGFGDKAWAGLFEFRLDVFLVRIKIAKTLEEARAMLVAGMIMVNGVVRTTYRYSVGRGDTINVMSDWLPFFQLRQISELYRSLEQPVLALYRVFPNYIEGCYRTLSFTYLKNKFLLARVPILSTFKIFYAFNCGRFLF